MNGKILETAMKLKALSERGIDGEKENAISMLLRFMDKHGITAEMIEGVKVTKHSVWLEPVYEKNFFRQICSNVLGDGFTFISYAYKLGKYPGKNRYGIECTDAEFIEIQAKHEFYFKHFLEELDIFRSAFIQKNKIYQKPKDEDDEYEERELTLEERQRLLKIANIMNGMDRKVFLKQLN